MVHFRSRGIGLEQCIQLMKNSRNGTIWFHGEREKNTKLFFYHYLLSILVSTPAGVEELRRWGFTIIKKWRRIILPHPIFELRLY